MNKKTIHLYPTLRCNGKCSYCSNSSPTQKGVYSYDEKMPGYWIKLIQNLDPEGWTIYLTGGEIFLYNGISDVLESIPEKASVCIYTNGMLISEKNLICIKSERISFRCSYHTGIGTPEDFLTAMEMLKQRSIPFQIFMVDSPEEDALAMRIGFFRVKGYEIGIDYDQRRHLRKKGRVRCFLPTKIVSPEGIVFHCVSRMIRHKKGEENLFENQEIKDIESTLCDEPETCAPCDLAVSYQEVVV